MGLVIPLHLKTKELCEEAMYSSRGVCIKFVPVCLRTEEMCFETIKIYNMWSFIPDESKSKRVCEEAIKRYGLSLSPQPSLSPPRSNNTTKKTRKSRRKKNNNLKNKIKN